MSDFAVSAPPRCASCRSYGEIVGRGLCGQCYHQGPIRAQFDAFGRRAYPPAAVQADVNEYAPPPLPVGESMTPGPPRRRRRRAVPAGADPEAQRRADDAALLVAVAELARAGQYVVEDTGEPVAGAWAATRLAGLTPKAGAEAVARLLAAGAVERCGVRVVHPGGGTGRAAAGLRRREAPGLQRVEEGGRSGSK